MLSSCSNTPETSGFSSAIRQRSAGLWACTVVAIGMLAVTSSALAQAQKKFVVDDRELIGSDVKLKLTYYKSNGGAEAPVIVLLHGKKGARQQWKDLAVDLQQKGDFAVVAVDLRGHGESVTARKSDILKKSDYQAMVAVDMELIKEFLLDEHLKKHLNVNKLGIVGCDFSTSVALLYTELDWLKEPYDDSPVDSDKTPRGQDVQALVLITPDPTTPGLAAHKAVPAIKALNRPVMIAVSEKNNHDVGVATKMFEQLVPKKEKEERKEEPPFLLKYEGNLGGMDLVTRNPVLRANIFAFLNKYVKEHQSEWRDRRSRLDRE